MGEINMSEQSADNTLTKSKLKTSSWFLPLLFILIVSIAGLTIFIVYLGSNQNSKESTQSVEETNIFWSVNKLMPVENSSNFNLTLESNAGAIRSYENISSYGLSDNGKFLTFNGQNGIELVELENDKRSKILTPSAEFGGDTEDSIDWSFDNNYFAIAVNLAQDSSNQKLWIFNNQGALVKEIDVKAPIKQTTKTLIEKSIFSNFENLIMIRTYKTEDLEFKKDDGTNFAIDELPIYLSVFNMEGVKVSDLNIRDYDVSKEQLFYSWDSSKIGFIKYALFATERPSLNQEHLFTKIAI